MQEDVAQLVGVAGDEVGRHRFEHHVAAVAADPGAALAAVACVPPVATLTRTVAPVVRLCTRTSGQLGPARFAPGHELRLVSSAVNAAADTNVTKRPSAEMSGATLSPSASAPSVRTLTRVTAPVSLSFTKTSANPFVSPATSVVAVDENATNRPSALALGCRLAPASWAFAASVLTRVVRPCAPHTPNAVPHATAPTTTERSCPVSARICTLLAASNCIEDGAHRSRRRQESKGTEVYRGR